MHFVEYPMRSREITRQAWADLRESVLDHVRAQRHRREAAEILLRRGLFGSGPAASSRSGSAPAGGWQPASWDSLAAEAASRGASRSVSGAPSRAQMGQQLVPEGASPFASGLLTSSSLSQPLESSPSGSFALPTPASSISSGASWPQPQPPRNPGLIQRTVSRRQLFAPPAQPQQAALLLLKESFDDAEAETGRAVKDLALGADALKPPGQDPSASAPLTKPNINHEWQAYEQHLASRKASLDLSALDLEPNQHAP
jgi:hypothetical protein